MCERAPANANLEPTAKRPRIDEIRSAAKCLRQEAAKLRSYARGHRERAEKSPEAPWAGGVKKLAERYDKAAERYERVAAWMVEQ